MRHRRAAIAAISGALLVTASGVAVARNGRPAVQARPAAAMTASAQAAAVDRSDLALAARSIENEALASGALQAPSTSSSPAAVILDSDQALLTAARADDPSRTPRDEIKLMGAVPYAIAHGVSPQPYHRFRGRPRTLDEFHRAVRVGTSAGIGLSEPHEGAYAAPLQPADGVFVDPKLPALRHPTIAAVAIRTALRSLGQPYVWAAAGPSTFDCSGLVRWSYGHAGIALTHYTGTQWNEGRLIPARDALPGDLLLYGVRIDHVGIYLGAGWMVNAPFTGHYVDVVPVEKDLAGVIRP